MLSASGVGSVWPKGAADGMSCLFPKAGSRAQHSPKYVESRVSSRFTQVSPDRAYLVRVVRTREDEYFPAIYTRRTNQVRDVFQNVRVNLAALAVERVWLRKCPTRCIAGQSVESLAARLPAGIPVDGCPRCEGSPKRGWVVEACPKCRGRKTVCKWDGIAHDDYGAPPYETQTKCPDCNAGQHVERIGLVEALTGMEEILWVVEQVGLALPVGQTRESLPFRRAVIALLTEGAEQ